MGAPTNFFVKIHEKSGHVNAAQINIGFNETNGYHVLKAERINHGGVERQKIVKLQHPIWKKFHKST